ncbi:DoxX family protein [Ensifer adhaerens]|uniref:DoxX family protein n=1 Tax=Ensifer adhaerens TaxID=106592 RepID=UPI001CBBD1F3|nr:DoxX family protein [Ensifer adhaerens]MBZ7920173.1 DoxX family protein [Ensifer adhaerens]UAX92672.1 DoxX family protein [Ensifer adhaerens]UAY00308.1 DoxX family protein [Ensifer adhaerens]UAY07690.1 DoxX family protein [Ensifer adhaerens]
MNTSLVLPVPTTKSVILGRALSGLVILFLVFDGAIKLVPLPVVTETMAALGYPADQGLARLLGAMTLLCTVLYAIPRTSILGAILLTGYLGGAMATHLRAGSPLFTHLLFGLYLGVIAWGGLWLRDPRLRSLIPFKN